MKARSALLVVVLLGLVAPVAAHVPQDPTDNTSPERAVEVPKAAKSWSFYDEISEGQPQYYRLTLAAGQRLRVGTFTPVSGAFTPSLVVMSRSLNRTDDVPDGVTVPEGMGAVVVRGSRPDAATYEPFAPSANYHTTDVDWSVPADATYLVAVYEPAKRSGPAGVAIGYREEFTPAEYVTVPFALVRTHLWEGQHPLVVGGAFLLPFLVGLGAVRRRWDRTWERTPVRYALAGGGLLVLASGLNTLVQMGLALARTGPQSGALVTAVFVVVPVVCGWWAVTVALRDDVRLAARTRVGVAAAGVAALATWAGFVVGPLLLALVAVAPERFSGTRR